MRVRALLLTLVIPAFGAGITACGQQAHPRVPRVGLELRSPADGTRVSAASITVNGTVSPARAEVQVYGRRASVKPDGSFSARVSLRPGVNLIDVLASLPHASGATAALRVERYILVAVPQVLGESASDAETALRAAGLVPQAQSGDNALTSLLPLPEQVCAASPQPGTRVSPGSTVTLSTDKICGAGATTGAPQQPPTQQPPAHQPGHQPPGHQPPAYQQASHPAPVPADGHGHGNGPNGTGPPGQAKKAGLPGDATGSQDSQGNDNGD